MCPIANRIAGCRSRKRSWIPNKISWDSVSLRFHPADRRFILKGKDVSFNDTDKSTAENMAL